MITIEYCAEGVPVNDFEVESWWRGVMDADTVNHFQVSTSAPIFKAKLAVASQEIAHTNIQFMFKGKIITVNQYGAVEGWPEGFCDSINDMCELTLHLSLIRKERNETRSI